MGFVVRIEKVSKSDLFVGGDGYFAKFLVKIFFVSIVNGNLNVVLDRPQQRRLTMV